MPDFLHEPTGSSTQRNAPTEGVRVPAANALANGGQPPPLGAPAMRAAEPLKDRSHAVLPPKRKMPLVIFTHYYGVFFLLIVAAFLGGGYVLLAPRYASMTTIAGETASAVATLDEDQSYLDALNRSIRAAEEIPTEVLERVDEAIPSEQSGIPKLLVTVSAIARESGVELGNIEFSAGGPGAAGSGSKKLAVVPIGISLNIQADGYQEMRRFLSNLESSLRLINVDSVTVSAATEKVKVGEVEEERIAFSYALQLTTYMRAKAVSAPPPAPAQTAPSVPLTTEASE